MAIDGVVGSSRSRMSLDPLMNAHDGRLIFYRGELFLDHSELEGVNTMLATENDHFGKALMIEVKTPPLLPAIYPNVVVPSMLSPLPARSTRSSLPNYGTSVRTSGGGKVKQSDEKPKSESAPTRSEKQSKPTSSAIAAPLPRFSETPKPVIPLIKANSEKVHGMIRKVFESIVADPDYACLQDEFIPAGLFPSPSMSLTIIRDRVMTLAYEDHFQFMDDIVLMCTFWIQGPPQPNPTLPHFLASLKLLRNGTDIMMASLIGEIDNDDYYTGPNVEEAIRNETRREEAELKAGDSQKTASTTSSPSFARKVKKSGSVGGKTQRVSGSGPGADSQLRTIEQQVSMLTQQVLGLQKSSGPRATPRTSASGAGASADSRPLSAEDIRKLESDLMTLEPEDIDHIVTSILKDEPSVRIEDDSYELDVSALPPVKQRNLRRYVTRKLNMRDPSYGAQKLKQLLRDDELAMESEQIAERLLATSALPSPVGVPALPPAPTSLEDTEAERQRQDRERQREEEAKRLWQLAHGDDDSMDMD